MLGAFRAQNLMYFDKSWKILYDLLQRFFVCWICYSIDLPLVWQKTKNLKKKCSSVCFVPGAQCSQCSVRHLLLDPAAFQHKLFWWLELLGGLRRATNVLTFIIFDYWIHSLWSLDDLTAFQFLCIKMFVGWTQTCAFQQNVFEPFLPPKVSQSTPRGSRVKVLGVIFICQHNPLCPSYIPAHPP